MMAFEDVTYSKIMFGPMAHFKNTKTASFLMNLLEA